MRFKLAGWLRRLANVVYPLPSNSAMTVVIEADTSQATAAIEELQRKIEALSELTEKVGKQQQFYLTVDGRVLGNAISMEKRA